MSIKQPPEKVKHDQRTRDGAPSRNPAMLERWARPEIAAKLVARRKSHCSIGAIGEAITAEWLAGGGYDVRDIKHADLAAIDRSSGETIYIEVKTARPGRDGCYQATLEKAGHTSVTNSDRLILICLTPGGAVPFSIPVSILNGRRKIVITSNPRTYAGQWAPYRTSWEVNPL